MSSVITPHKELPIYQPDSRELLTRWPIKARCMAYLKQTTLSQLRIIRLGYKYTDSSYASIPFFLLSTNLVLEFDVAR